jgi:hypothetical protein
MCRPRHGETLLLSRHDIAAILGYSVSVVNKWCSAAGEIHHLSDKESLAVLALYMERLQAARYFAQWQQD